MSDLAESAALVYLPALLRMPLSWAWAYCEVQIRGCKRAIAKAQQAPRAQRDAPAAALLTQ